MVPAAALPLVTAPMPPCLTLPVPVQAPFLERSVASVRENAAAPEGVDHGRLNSVGGVWRRRLRLLGGLSGATFAVKLAVVFGKLEAEIGRRLV